jgi:serine/threonine-protein kinase HipA
MRRAEVWFKGEVAALLQQLDDGSFVFRYHDVWFEATNKPPISLSLPKSQQEYRSAHLFPFFYNMLPEGANKQTVCYALKIDPDDHFGILLNTAQFDTIGAVQVKRQAE